MRLAAFRPVQCNAIVSRHVMLHILSSSVMHDTCHAPAPCLSVQLCHASTPLGVEPFLAQLCRGPLYPCNAVPSRPGLDHRTILPSAGSRPRSTQGATVASGRGRTTPIQNRKRPTETAGPRPYSRAEPSRDEPSRAERDRAVSRVG